MRMINHDLDSHTDLNKEIDGNLPHGTLIGPYMIERCLGKGGMGQVYLAARMGNLKHKVALKTVHNWIPEIHRRFELECKILSELRHPNIAQLIDAGIQDSGQPWFSMEYVDGMNLTAYLAKRKPSLQQRLELFLRLCDGLSYAHQNMIIHRDLKPENIIITENGIPKLVDFGIAATLNPETGSQKTVTILSERMMTLNYASPEQIDGERLTALSDVYSLGVIFYEMLTGERPYQFNGNRVSEIMRTLHHVPIMRPSVKSNQTGKAFRIAGKQLKGDLDQIGMMALKLEPSERYASVEAFADDIRRYLSNLPVKARQLNVGYRLRMFVKRNPWPMAATSLVLLMMTLFILEIAAQKARVEQERDRVAQEKETSTQVTDFLLSMFQQADPDLSQKDLLASEILDRGRKSIEHNLSDKPQIQAQLFTTLGKVYRSLGELKSSEETLNRALEIAPPDQQVLISLELSETLIHLSRFKAADSLLSSLLSAYPKTLYKEEYLKIRHKQGRLAYELCRYMDAQEILEETYRESQVLEKPLQIDIKRDLALNMHEIGENTDSIAYMEDVLRQIDAHYGKIHSSYAYASIRLARMHAERSRPVEAEEHLEVAKSIVLSLFSEEHPLMIKIQHTQGYNYLSQYKIEEAKALYIDLVDQAKRILGYNNVYVAAILNDHDTLNRLQGNYEKAEALAREAMAIRHELLPLVHEDNAVGYWKLAAIAIDKGEPDKAEKYMERAEEIYTEIFTGVHPDLASIYFTKARLYRQTGDNQKARDYFQKSYDIHLQSFGPKSSLAANSLIGIAVSLQSEQKYREATTLLKEALTSLKEHFNISDPRVVMAYSHLAASLRQEGKYAEAQDKLEEIIDLVKTPKDGDPIFLNDVRMEWNRIAHDRGQFSEAISTTEGIINSLPTPSKNDQKQRHAAYNLALAMNLIPHGDYTSAQQVLKQVEDLLVQPDDNGKLYLAFAKKIRADLQLSLWQTDNLISHYDDFLTNYTLDTGRDSRFKFEALLGKATYHLHMQQWDELNTVLKATAVYADPFVDPIVEIKYRLLQAAIANSQREDQVISSTMPLLIDDIHQKLGDTHPLYAEALMILAESLSRQQNFRAAIHKLNEAQKTFQLALQPEHETIIMTRFFIAAFNYHRTLMPHHQSQAKEALDKLIERLGENHPTTKKAQSQFEALPQPSELGGYSD